MEWARLAGFVRNYIVYGEGDLFFGSGWLFTERSRGYCVESRDGGHWV